MQVSQGAEEKAERLAATRKAWTAIGRDDLLKQLDDDLAEDVEKDGRSAEEKAVVPGE